MPSQPSLSLPGDEENPDTFGAFMGRVWAKMKREPLVPVCLTVTIFALGASARAINQNNQNRAQMMFRLRVAAQTATVAALVGGMLIYGNDSPLNRKQKEANEERDKERAKVRHQLWLDELDRENASIMERKARVEKARQVRKQQQEQQGEPGSQE